jgi:hypothetical protein
MNIDIIADPAELITLLETEYYETSLEEEKSE